MLNTNACFLSNNNFCVHILLRANRKTKIKIIMYCFIDVLFVFLFSHIVVTIRIVY